jgi:hypothetical protein
LQKQDDDDEHEEPLEEEHQENINDKKFVPSCIHIQKAAFFKPEACADAVMAI